MGRSPCCSKEGLNRGAWTAHEDKILKDYIRLHGEGRWRSLPKRAGLKRCGKSCRLRWLNYLRPDIKRGNISSDEEELIIRLHKLLGNRWSLIAGRLPGRTDNEIKNYWNTNLGKKVKDQNNQTRSTNVPTQADEKSTENIPKLSPSPSSPAPHKTESHVVRTKATKCSKVLLINPLPPPPPPQNKPNIAEAQEGRPNKSPITIDHTTEPSLYDNDNVFLSPDSLIDYYNVGDVCVSDLLNSDFSNVCDFGYGNDGEMLSPCSEQPPVFSDEILKDWTLTDMSNNLHSFTSLLESGEG